MAKGNGRIAFEVEEVAPDTKPTLKKGKLVVPMMARKTMWVKIVGLTGLIHHKHSERMLDKRENDLANPPLIATSKGRKNQEQREPLNAFREFVEALYIMPGMEKKVASLPKIKPWGTWPYVKGAFGIPAVAFKAGMLRASKAFGGEMVDVKTWFYVKGVYTPRCHDLVVIDRYDSITMRRDPKVLPNGNMDLRYRGEFHNWSATLEITYNSHTLSEESILGLVQHAGSVGVCDDRPGTKKATGSEKGVYEVKGE